MMQTLHIFRKDIRHLWADVSLYAVLLIASSVITPMGWTEVDTANPTLRIFINLLQILLPIIWLVLIARLIHDESLVGDTQFWITRPYTWTSLLSAKILFIVVFVALPMAVAQWAMVLEAGLHPLHTVPGQLLDLLQTGLIVWLTFTVVASVTSTIQRMFISVVGVVLFWIAALTILSGPPGPRMSLPFAADVFVIGIGGLLIGILLYQYATRDTFRSRIALVATACLFVALFACLVDGYIQTPINLFVRHHYALSSDLSLRLAFDANVKPNNPEGFVHSDSRFIIIRVPVRVEGLAPNDQLDGQNVAFIIDAPGYHYASPWRPAFGSEGTLRLFIPTRVINATHGSNLHLHISEIAQRLISGTPQTVTATKDFSVPGEGRCYLAADLVGNDLTCRFAFQIVERTTVRGAVTTGACSSSGSVQPGIATIHVRDPIVALDPTMEVPLNMGGAICPGTQLTFTPYHPAENFRLELDIPSISLDAYVTR